MGKGLTDAC